MTIITASTVHGEPAIRMARREDGPRCNDFYNRHYGRTRTLRQWEWEFCRPNVPGDPGGTIPLAVAELGDDVVGTQALIPIELIDAAGTYWSAKSEETLVDQSMRGRGLFHRLYEPLLAFARQHDISPIWGFTPARQAFEREGFAIPVRTAQLVRAFTSQAFSALLADAAQKGRATRFLPLGSRLFGTYGTVVASVARRHRSQIEIVSLDAPPGWADELSREFASAWGGTTLHRSADYLAWRFFANPFRRPLLLGCLVSGKPAGWIAFGIGSQGTAAIVDIIAVPASSTADAHDVTIALIDAATERARNMGAAAMRAWNVTDHPFSRVVARSARRLGWVDVRRGFDMVLKNTPGIQPRADSQPIGQWYITRAFTEGSDV